MDERLFEIIGRIPAWASATSVQASILSGGISNQNYRVSVDGESFVVRVCGKDTELLGVNRQSEYVCSLIAAETGIAPEVVAFFPDLGSIVSRYIEGKKIPAREIASKHHLSRFARSIRRLHAARPFPGTFSPFQAAEDYRGTAGRLGAPLPSNIDDLFQDAARIEQALYGAERRPHTPVPCHNDLLNENLLDDGAIRIIDYEYAAMGDALFDLANFSAHHRLDDIEERWLIEAYLANDDRTPGANEVDTALARLKLLRLASDLREALWGAVQVKLSALEFDYQSYTAAHFVRCEAMGSDPRLPHWLSLASGGLS